MITGPRPHLSVSLPGNDGEGEHSQGVSGDHHRYRSQWMFVGLHVNRGDRHRDHHDHLGKDHTDHGHANPRLFDDLRQRPDRLQRNVIPDVRGRVHAQCHGGPVATQRRLVRQPESNRQNLRYKVRQAQVTRPPSANRPVGPTSKGPITAPTVLPRTTLEIALPRSAGR